MNVQESRRKLLSPDPFSVELFILKKSMKIDNLMLDKVFEVDYEKGLNEAEEILYVGSSTCIDENGLTWIILMKWKLFWKGLSNGLKLKLIEIMVKC